MKLEKKKQLAARVLGVGKGRIIFNIHRLSEIKEAITYQDIRDLHSSGAILIKETKGRKKVNKRRHRRREGSIKGKAKMKKRHYVILTRKLRNYLKILYSKGKISRELYYKLRKEIRNREFKSLANFKERIAGELK